MKEIFTYKKESQGYPLIDKMRVIAAILVAAIHISPFILISENTDFFITRIIARLAVPFFFMTSGFFLFSDTYPTLTKIKRTLTDLLKWYILASILYIPLLLYNDYFSQTDFSVNLIRDIFIDGTFYHLWYFPAVIIGIIMVLILKKLFSTKTCFIITGILYFIGLCGDSYYEVFIHIPIVNTWIEWLFQYMDYTRNGFFFAPLFLMIGILLREQKSKLKLSANITFFIFAFLSMSIEAILVHNFHLFKHDAMYVFLPLVSYFLFSLLIRKKGKRYRSLKDISLYLYILHPFMIVIVRLLGKLTHISSLIEDNFIQYIVVLLLTCGLSLLIYKLNFTERICHMKKRKYFYIIIVLGLCFAGTQIIKQYNANSTDTLLKETELPNTETIHKLKKMAEDDERIKKVLVNYNEYPEEILKLLSENIETLDYVLDYPSKKGNVYSDTIGTIHNNEIPSLFQWDERWGYASYGDNVLAINGCGPTVLSMVISGLTNDNTITPYVVAQYAQQNGYYVDGTGSSWELMTEGAAHFGILGNELPLSKDTVFSTLESGMPIICSMLPGDFTSTGHYIVLAGMEDGMIKVNDPNSKKRSNKLWSYEDLQYQINNLWYFSRM